MNSLLCTAALVAVLSESARTSDEKSFIPETSPPNVVLVMTDDQGFGDFGFAGNAVIETPHLDAMHSASARIRSFYVSPVCAPTRASLMTGRWNYRTRVVDTYIGRAMMEPAEVTIAEVLIQAGWRTGLFGKWHLGDCYPLRAMDQGFERTLVHRGGGIGQPSDPIGAEGKYSDAVLFANGERVETKGYCTDVYFDAAIEFMREARAQEQPFFCTITTNAPHGPFGDVPEDLFARYREKDLSPDRYERIGAALPAKWDDEKLARIFAMITNIDDNVGKLFSALREMEALENTLVLFLTDNGPNTRRFNAGLRGMKSEVFEGGVRTPLLAHWPARLKAGIEVNRPAAHVDLMPTILDACGVSVPESLHIDGRSCLPLLEGKDTEWPERDLVIQAHRGDVPLRYHNFFLRRGDYKLLSSSGFGRELDSLEPKFELYNLKNDPFEQANLATAEPERVLELVAAYDVWFDDVCGTRPDNFAPPRIVVGSERAPIVHLTRQDWRRSSNDGGWSKDSRGAWELNVERDVMVRVEVEPLPGRKVLNAELTYNRVKPDGSVDGFGPARTLVSREGKLEEIAWEVPMAVGNWRLQVLLEDEAGRFGAYQVRIETLRQEEE